MKTKIGKSYITIKETYFWTLLENNTLLGKKRVVEPGEIMIFLGHIGSFYNVYYFDEKFYSPMVGVSQRPYHYMEELV